MNKFKNIENIAPNKVDRKLVELEALRIEAKNLRQRFEQNVNNNLKQNEEKKCQLKEEFEYFTGFFFFLIKIHLYKKA